MQDNASENNLPIPQSPDQLYSLIQAIRKNANFSHSIDKYELVETHISYLLLTGPYVYKFKKPLNLGFLDFSTLEKRKYYCEEEIRLNRRLAPELYLDVVNITGTKDLPELSGDGPVIEYAVKMKQFHKGSELDQLLESGQLTKFHFDKLALQIADFHKTATIASASSNFGQYETVMKTVMSNISKIEKSISMDTHYHERILKLKQWTENSLKQSINIFKERKENGFIRECHGDMHLGNIAYHDNQIIVFDCIEFSDELRWIDVMNEIAFLVMDLDDRDQTSFSYRFLNSYLELSGDYEGLSVLPFYYVYRALVRSKVSCIRLQQSGLSNIERLHEIENYRHHIDTSCRYIEKRYPVLLITYGFSGSGKTTVSQDLMESLGAIRIRSDIERKRLYGINANIKQDPAIDQGIYSKNSSNQTYQKLCDLAKKLLMANYNVIVDATFLRKKHRTKFQNIANDLDLPFIILDFQSQINTLRQRIIKRDNYGNNASDADLSVLDYQIATQEPLNNEEKKSVISINTEFDIDLPLLVKQVEKYKSCE